jgi:hypothetical protein
MGKDPYIGVEPPEERDSGEPRIGYGSVWSCIV